MGSGNKTVYVAVLSVFGALAAADAGHEDEDGFNSNWLIAQVDCAVEPSAEEPSLTSPEYFAMPASLPVTQAWTQYRDCESR